ncbi:hypothetical protein PQE87_gp53 [Streptococcus phage CHPC1042]|uniref:Uncharacterized protein n=1 Tax=Streptococcus phage CHPC1042 TaxID=2365016 RepID=A0A3G8FCJ4_9CAUD|nr:hypothetical protein PQE87_gp53 [Streptococcus phage CHPC1042]AZF91562.1 hypothetical protein CHPC1042_0053 [Streptococcus phage CHPC1042]
MNALVFVKLINLQEKVTKQFTIRKDNENIMTLQQLAMKSGKPYAEQLSLFAEDSLAKLSPSQVKEKDSLMKLVERLKKRQSKDLQLLTLEIVSIFQFQTQKQDVAELVNRSLKL